MAPSDETVKAEKLKSDLMSSVNNITKLIEQLNSNPIYTEPNKLATYTHDDASKVFIELLATMELLRKNILNLLLMLPVDPPYNNEHIVQLASAGTKKISFNDLKQQIATLLPLLTQSDLYTNLHRDRDDQLWKFIFTDILQPFPLVIQTIAESNKHLLENIKQQIRDARGGFACKDDMKSNNIACRSSITEISYSMLNTACQLSFNVDDKSTTELKFSPICDTNKQQLTEDVLAVYGLLFRERLRLDADINMQEGICSIVYKMLQALSGFNPNIGNKTFAMLLQYLRTPDWQQDKNSNYHLLYRFVLKKYANGDPSDRRQLVSAIPVEETAVCHSITLISLYIILLRFCSNSGFSLGIMNRGPIGDFSDQAIETLLKSNTTDFASRVNDEEFYEAM
jgi:hypothetical protein